MKRLEELSVTFLNDVDFEFIVPENTEILTAFIIDDEIKLRVLRSQSETIYIKRRFRIYRLSDVIDDKVIKSYIGALIYNNEERHIFEMNISEELIVP